MTWSYMSKDLRFLQITAEHQNCPFFTVFLLAIKTSSQNISMTLSQIPLKLHEHLGGSWRKKLPWTILEEQLPVPRKTAASKIGDGVSSFLRLFLTLMSVIATLIITNFHLCLIQLWRQFFTNLCLWRRSLCSNLGGIDPEKLYRATLKFSKFAWLKQLDKDLTNWIRLHV